VAGGQDEVDAPWATGHVGTGWDEMVGRTCRALGGFEPDVRHRANDAYLTLALVSQGLAVSLVPDLVRPGDWPGVVVAQPEAPISRRIFVATRESDDARPAVQALLRAIQDAAAAR
jgi:DNA-binding transcriptional LysR family regulator